MCSTALVVQPPAVANADVAAPAAAAATSTDSKKGGAKGKPASQDSKVAGAAAAKPRPGMVRESRLFGGIPGDGTHAVCCLPKEC
jgi:hypothetical protein